MEVPASLRPQPKPWSRPSSPATPAARLASAPKLPASLLAAVTTLVLLVVAGILIAANPGGMRAHLFPSTQAAQIHSIAVLPLANHSADSSQDYFADGAINELLIALAEKPLAARRLPDLRHAI